MGGAAIRDFYEKLSLLIARLRNSGEGRHGVTVAVGLALVAASAFFLTSCGGSSGSSGGGGGSTPAVPSIQNVNNSTAASSPVSLSIEINGSGFQNSPGKVVFTQAATGITATVTPSASAWTSSHISVTVPTGDGTTQFTTPGSVSVQVTTAGGTSNSVTLTLLQTLSFNAGNVTWTTTTPLPVALAGLSAVAVPVSSSSAFVVLTGGNNGTSNTSFVYCNTLNPSGTVGPDWQTIPTNPLPVTLAYHAMVEADSSNSLVPAGSHFIYVIGGQVSSAGTPGGTADIFMASVNPNSGAVGAWTQLTTPLPQPLIGPAVAIINGYIYVVGGLQTDSNPSQNVYSAAVNADGTLGTWTQAPNPYPMAISFATAFGYSGRLYVLGGDNLSSVSPGAQGSAGVNNVNFASVQSGTVGAWTTTSATLMQRKKQVTWETFGQVIDAEGVYVTPGALEQERTQVNTDGTLATWIGITAGASQIGANVYNAAAIVSPLPSGASTPRLLLFGGQGFVTFSPGPLSNEVYYNNAP